MLRLTVLIAVDNSEIFIYSFVALSYKEKKYTVRQH